MKASNIVVSTVAALSMAGVLGIAYAQSTYSDTPTGTTNPEASGTMNQPDATGATQGSSTSPQGSTSMDSSTNMDSTSTSSSEPMYNERVARADRN